MSHWQLLLRSLRYHARMHLLVMLSVAVATAVLTGALVVGDSVRGSLRQLTLDRLGPIDGLLLSEQFFRHDLVRELADTPPPPDSLATVRRLEGLCILPQITIERQRSDAMARAGRVFLVGYASGAQLAPSVDLQADEIMLNQPLADELQAEVGDEVILRLPDTNRVPADSPLANKETRVRSRAGLTVTRILPAEGWGRFQLHASQQQSRNAFVSIDTLQDALGIENAVNAIAVQSSSDNRDTDPQLVARLQAKLRPKLADYGLRVEKVKATYRTANDEQREARLAWSYWQVTSERMLWQPAAREAAIKAFAAEPGWDAQEVFTYLANTISRASPTGSVNEIPYSTITAIDPHPQLGPLTSQEGAPPHPLANDEIVLNSWAAEDLGAEVGDLITIRFFDPQTTHGVTEERASTFRLKHVVALVEPIRPAGRNRPALFDQPPATANDPMLTPRVEGVTDQASIDDWDPPFPFDQSRIRAEDDNYWENHRTTPKAFIGLNAGKRIWDSRFGTTTSFRLPPGSKVTAERIATVLQRELNHRKSELGFQFMPVKSDGLRAAAGTTPFQWLFLGFSFFLMAAALMLVAILFQLAVLLRGKELGTMLAVGWTPRDVRWTLWIEEAVVALLGGIVGAFLGVAYAALMLTGLQTWWLDAIVTPFLSLHVSAATLFYGFLSGTVVCGLVVWQTMRSLGRVSARGLLTGKTAHDFGRKQRGEGRCSWTAIGLLILAATLGFLATRLSGEAQAGAFFGSGAAVLTSLLIQFHRVLLGETSARMALSLNRLAWRAAARNPARSMLTIGLMSTACFLVVAIAAFRLTPSESGTGGFEWLAESDHPIFIDLNSPSQRERLFGEKSDELQGATILPLRVHDGQDASCRNLYQAARPRLLGVSSNLMEFFDVEGPRFSLARFEPPAEGASQNPWRRLESSTDDDAHLVPVVLDKNTALYSLHLSGGIGEEFELAYDPPIRFRVVGLLSNTVLQGNLLVSEANLTRLFPDSAGYRMFLIDAPKGAAKVASLLEDRFGNEGLDARDSLTMLRDLMAVQNTYLSTFQSLGGLGLLLGTIGLGLVQVRNVVERRAELGLMSSFGFPRWRLARLLGTENIVLLLVGLGVGLTAALVAVLPHMMFGGAKIPMAALLGTLLLVLGVGIVASLAATRFVARASILEALRED